MSSDSSAFQSAQNNVEDNMIIMPLGGGQEVGRSSILLQFRGRNIMLDCGSHPGNQIV
jgi:cleavage and polyadenylation specificity factor subunit 3